MTFFSLRFIWRGSVLADRSAEWFLLMRRTPGTASLHLHTDVPTCRVLKDDIAFTLIEDGNKLQVNVPSINQHVARMILLEESLSLSDLFESTK